MASMFSIFLLVKIICAPNISRTFVANNWDGLPRYCIVRRGGESFNDLSFLGSDAFTSKFLFSSMILLRVSNTTLSGQFFGYWFSIHSFRFFSNAWSKYSHVEVLLKTLWTVPSITFLFCTAKVRSLWSLEWCRYQWVFGTNHMWPLSLNPRWHLSPKRPNYRFYRVLLWWFASLDATYWQPRELSQDRPWPF